MLRFLTAGESHGQALVATLDGLPAGLDLDFGRIDAQLRRRQGGYGRGRRMAIESDRAEILSGVRHGRTTGAPIALLIRNKDWVNWQQTMFVEPEMPPDAAGSNKAPVTRPRPGHADLAGAIKYGHSDVRDVLERASARETAARVAVGTIARQLLAHFGMEVVSHVAVISNGEDLRVTGFMKPISTLMKPLRSIDLTTLSEAPAAIERSDVCAVPAAAVVAEAMVAFVLADAFLEKFGGDSIDEIERHYGATRDEVRRRFARPRSTV